MRPHFALTALTMTFALSAFVSECYSIGPAPTWLPRETVVSGLGLAAQHEGADRILAYDHLGNPGIIFDGGDNAFYARRVPTAGWKFAVADGAGTGAYPSLAFDRRERPAFVSSTVGPKFSSFNGTFFTGQNLDQVNDFVDYTTLAFDSAGAAAIAYRDQSDADLKYIKDVDNDGLLTDETPQSVAVAGSMGLWASLAFDNLDRPVISHADGINFDLLCSIHEPGIGWITTTVDSAGATGFHASLAIDPDTGYAAIAYFDNSVFDLRFASWNGTSWDRITIDSVGNTGLYPSLAFDPADGNPAISYYDSTNGDLKLAWHNGAIWQTQPVDTVGNVGVYTSIAFNEFGDGFPSIAYFDNTATTLFFIEDPLAVPEPASIVLVAMGVPLAVFVARRQRARHIARPRVARGGA